MVAVIFSAPFCFSQETAAAKDTTFAALQKDVEKMGKSAERIEQEVQGLKASGAETQKKIGQVEENLGRKIDDSKTEIQKNLNQTLGDSLRKVEKNLGQKIDDSTAKTEEKLGQISGGVKKIFCLIFAFASILVLVCGVVFLRKRMDKNEWLTVEVEANGAKNVFDVLTKYSPRKKLYTSPFMTSGKKTGTRGAIDRNTVDATAKHYKSALKQAIEDPTSDFALQMANLMKEGKIKEIK